MSERDEIDQARRQKAAKYRKKRRGVVLRIALALLAVVVLASLVTAATFKDVSDFFICAFSGGSYPAELATSTPTDVIPLSMSYVVQGGNSAAVYSSGGSLLQTISPGYSALALAAQGNRILVYNRGAQQAGLYNRTRQICEYTAPGAILSAAVGGRYAALLCENDRYAAQLTLYNADGETVFTWYCAEGFPYGVVFDNDASHRAVMAAYLEDGVLKTHLTVLDVRAQQETLQADVPFSALRVRLHNSAMTVIGDTGACTLNAEGTVTTQYDYGADTLLAAAYDRGNGVVLAFGDNSRPNVNKVVLLDKELQPLCTVRVGEKIKDVYLSRTRVYVLTDACVAAYSYNGAVADTYTVSYNAVAVLVRSKVIAFLPDSIVTAEG